MLVLGLPCTAVAWPILFRPPAFGVALGVLFLAEPLAPGTLVGAVLVLVSIGIRLRNAAALAAGSITRARRPTGRG